MNQSRLRECVDKEIGIKNHQACFQRQARRFPQGSDDRYAHGKIGHKMSIHHVDVDPVCAGAFGLGHLIAQMGKIGREDRRSELDCISRHVASLSLRYQRIRLLVELSCVSNGFCTLSSSGMIRCAKTFPNSTPHWSNESMPQTTPCVKTLCS